LDLQVYNDKLNIWAAWAPQYDQHTLKPAMARAYEPAAIGAWESLRIIAYLMKIENPDIKIQNAIHRAVAWYDYAVVKDWELKTENRNKMAVKVPGARNLWARFHSPETFEPIFIIVMPKGEENKVLYGIDKYNEMPQESRNRYQFIGNWAKNIKTDYAKWKQHNGL
jgi:PelA/Pel-15E family pectate lyase